MTAPFGVKGWVKIYSFASEPGSLRQYPAWWLSEGDNWRESRLDDCRIQSKALIARFDGVFDRDAAARLKGKWIAIPRKQLPAAKENEYYWADLVGLTVINKELHEFGPVARILETGANDVLVVSGGNGKEALIPFVAGVVETVDLAAGVIRVDWGRDY